MWPSVATKVKNLQMQFLAKFFLLKGLNTNEIL